MEVCPAGEEKWVKGSRGGVSHASGGGTVSSLETEEKVRSIGHVACQRQEGEGIHASCLHFLSVRVQVTCNDGGGDVEGLEGLRI